MHFHDYMDRSTVGVAKEPTKALTVLLDVDAGKAPSPER
jgi:hypothetical protein